MRNPAVAMAIMLTNDSYFMGNLYHLVIYSSNVHIIMKKANSVAMDCLCTKVELSHHFILEPNDKHNHAEIS